jgi:lysophospholipase L1-like esterase
MKKILILSATLVLFAVVLYFIFPKKVTTKNLPAKNNTLLIFGDSLAQGIGSTENNDLASLLSKDLSEVVINYGKSGDTTRDALERINEASEENAGIVMIILGGNDVLKKIPQEETFQNLEIIITHFQNKGSAIILVGVRSGLMGDGRGSDYSKLAKKTGSLYISDILKNVFGNTSYMSDAVHPNNAGYLLIEKRILPYIKEIQKK